jgi:hypothetical protein
MCAFDRFIGGHGKVIIRRLRKLRLGTKIQIRRDRTDKSRVSRASTGGGRLSPHANSIRPLFPRSPPHPPELSQHSSPPSATSASSPLCVHTPMTDRLLQRRRSCGILTDDEGSISLRYYIATRWESPFPCIIRIMASLDPSA